MNDEEITKRIETIEANIEQLAQLFAQLAVTIGAQRLADATAGKAGAWPSRDAMAHGYAQKTYLENLQGLIGFFADQASAVGTPQMNMLGKFARKLAQAYETQGRELSAELETHHAEIFGEKTK